MWIAYKIISRFCYGHSQKNISMNFDMTIEHRRRNAPEHLRFNASDSLLQSPLALPFDPFKRLLRKPDGRIKRRIIFEFIKVKPMFSLLKIAFFRSKTGLWAVIFCDFWRYPIVVMGSHQAPMNTPVYTKITIKR